MRVVNDEAVIDVRIDGESGDAIVLLAGLTLTREIWDAQAKTLAQTHRVIRPDLRGVGASNVPEGPYLMETHAGDVAAVLDALGIKRATIVGHSIGGYVAIAFARMYTERLARLALVGSRIDADTAEVSKIRYDLAARAESEHSSAAIATWLYPRMFAPGRYESDPELTRTILAMMNAADYRGAAATLRGMAMRDPGTDIAPDLHVPALVVAGALDQSVPMEIARDAAAAFPNSRSEIARESGHLSMMEEPERVSALLVGWLAQSAG